jgi:hypothetical protein
MIVFTEGRMAVPPGYREQTTNLLLPADPQQQPTFNITRDPLLPDETLDAYVDRQLGVLEARLTGYKLLARGPASLGPRGDACRGTSISARYRSGKQEVHQRQAVFLLDPQRALIFTISAGRPLSAEEEQGWTDWLASYQLPAELTPSSDLPSPATPNA